MVNAWDVFDASELVAAVLDDPTLPELDAVVFVEEDGVVGRPHLAPAVVRVPP